MKKKIFVIVGDWVAAALAALVSPPPRLVPVPAGRLRRNARR